MAATVGVEEGKVRVISPHRGGGFGGRVGSQPHHHLAALLSRKAGRPVRLRLSHEETFNLGNSLIIDLKTGVKQDGTLLARHLRIMADSIGNAIYDATGVRINGLPITPEKVLKAFEGNA
ncbi:MAG: molybdopterin-dependent oxidoreductase [Candidatus Tectomicrobia bacterium]|uniref:Molybdopterin-dependent oxidoreductase n=1 Tax=Tectimicrobiota bacterium TaxID=2528274 RepID=A0A932CNB2_UNCTE|nr:molybdopterin-dependent oxidoreductase [Candidatus Tectomicrobia bacterium]